jgi:Flp pilus assembly protein TadG
MRKIWRAFFAHRNRDERGAEFAAALFVFPVLFILIIGCVEIGFYVQARMRVENVLRDAARTVAIDGGNNNRRTNPGYPRSVSSVATSALQNGTRCKVSRCDGALLPVVDCNDTLNRSTGNLDRGNVVQYSGSTVTCKIVGNHNKYPYKPLAATLMDGPLGLGIGGILADFPASESARSETGTSG